MFDVGFSELVLLGLVALVVIGPERLPQAIRTTSLWINRMRRSINTIKAEIESELGTDEIRRQLHNEEIMRELKQSREQLKGLVTDAKASLQEADNSTRQLTSIPTEPSKDDQNKQRIAGN